MKNRFGCLFCLASFFLLCLFSFTSFLAFFFPIFYRPTPITRTDLDRSGQTQMDPDISRWTRTDPDSCASPSESLISLIYQMLAFSANSFGLFPKKITSRIHKIYRRCIFHCLYTYYFSNPLLKEKAFRMPQK